MCKMMRIDCTFDSKGQGHIKVLYGIVARTSMTLKFNVLCVWMKFANKSVVVLVFCWNHILGWQWQSGPPVSRIGTKVAVDSV